MSRVLVFGAKSLVGSHFVQTSGHRIYAAGLRDPRGFGVRVEGFREVDMNSPGAAATAVAGADVDAIINFGAATDVDRVENERPASPEAAKGAAYKVNVLAPAAMSKAARARGLPFVLLSTDFVFDGREGPYPESAVPSDWSPLVSWYGWTKGRGERLVLDANPSASVVRISYPYRTDYPRKLDFGRKILAARRQNAGVAYFDDQWITPTWIPDVTQALDVILERRKNGVFHVASPERTTPFEFARELVTQVEGKDPGLTPGSMEQFLQRPGATPRPRRGGLSCHRIEEEGLRLTSWRDGVRLLAEDYAAA